MIFDRIIGGETEFGITCPGRPNAHETLLSTLVVDSCPVDARQTDWDYHAESPLHDARGFTQPEEQAHSSQLTHRGQVLTSEDVARELIEESPEMLSAQFWDHATMNRVLPNGARFYVDHAHPEYSGPEADNPWDAALWDLAGDRIAQQAADRVPKHFGRQWPEPVALFKNNTDNKSVSYGAHENYLVSRRLDLQHLAESFIPFLATRQVITGAGRAGLGAEQVRAGFQISQRADFFERLVGLETTIRRPILNTRDEPHADPERFRRLHVIPGDANLSHTSVVLKYAMASAVLWLIEQNRVPEVPLKDPVAALQTISHDPTLSTTVALRDGRALTGLQIQRLYLDAVLRAVDEDEKELPSSQQRLLDLWVEVIEGLEHDPMSLADRLDWVAKYAMIRSYQQRGVDLDDPRIQALDLQYADLRPERCLSRRLMERGRLRRLFSEEQIQRAQRRPPETTRAWLRGQLISRWPDQVHAAGWEVLALRDPLTDRVHRWLLADPSHGGRAETEQVLARARSADHAARLLQLPSA